MSKNFNLDSHKLHYHFDRVAEFQKKGDCYPLYMEVSPVGLCNHRCIFCAYDYIAYPNRKLEKERYLSFLDEAAFLGVRSILYAGEGEPLLHPNITDFVEKTREVGIDCGMFSNGELLNAKKAESLLQNLTFLRFSFNGGNARTYSRIHAPHRNTDEKLITKVLKNITYATEFRAKNKLKVDLGSQFVLLRENQESLFDAIKAMRECGVDFISIKPFVHQNENQQYKNNEIFTQNELHDLIKEANAYTRDDFKVIFRENAFENTGSERGYTHCLGCNFISVLNSAGDLATCLPYWDNKDFVYGNIYKDNFYDIWNSERRKKIKDFLEHKLDCSTCPKNCRPNAINEFLSEILNPSVKHINFI